jgi:hypothetical protein
MSNTKSSIEGSFDIADINKLAVPEMNASKNI